VSLLGSSVAALVAFLLDIDHMGYFGLF